MKSYSLLGSVSELRADEVFTGTINELGVIQFKTTKIGMDITLARIIELVEETERSKAPIENVTDRYATYSFLSF